MNLAASEWIDENGLTWLAAAPKIKLIPDTHKRQPYPLNWDEQKRMMRALPDHLAAMALFAVNTGCRDAEVCGLHWDWEVQVPALETFVFIIPGEFVKNGDERLVVLNRVASSIVDAARGGHPTHVFHYRGNPIARMNNSAWRRAREEAGLPTVRVHDLKHTFGRRLRAAGVSFEDRQDLLGHRAGRITTHHSAAELSRLLGGQPGVRAGRKTAGTRGVTTAECGLAPQNPHTRSRRPAAVGSKVLIYMVARGGIEPPTRGFSVHCSTD